MSSELSQLDQLIESDVLEALGQEPLSEVLDSNNIIDNELTNVPEELQDEIIGAQSEAIDSEDFLDLNNEEEDIDLDDIEILPLAEIESAIEDQEDDIQITPNSLNELTSMISSLLKNKTIEITIKVKD